MYDEIPLSSITPEVVGKALCLLGRSDRLIIEMNSVHRLSHAEIGAKLKLSREGVIRRLARALYRLRNAVAEVLERQADPQRCEAPGNSHERSSSRAEQANREDITGQKQSPAGEGGALHLSWVACG